MTYLLTYTQTDTAFYSLGWVVISLAGEICPAQQPDDWLCDQADWGESGHPYWLALGGLPPLQILRGETQKKVNDDQKPNGIHTRSNIPGWRVLERRGWRRLWTSWGASTMRSVAPVWRPAAGWRRYFTQETRRFSQLCPTNTSHGALLSSKQR